MLQTKESTELVIAKKYSGTIVYLNRSAGIIKIKNEQQFIFTWDHCRSLNDHEDSHVIFGQLKIGMPIIFEECLHRHTPQGSPMRKATKIQMVEPSLLTKTVEATNSKLNDLLI